MNWLEAWTIAKLADLRPRLGRAVRGRQRGDIVTQMAISVGVAVVIAGAAMVAFYKVVGNVLDSYGTQLGNVGH
jgi:hypothetical protein